MAVAEISSGKNAAYENFPVASRLLSSRLRPHIVIFYRFARAIDDIADSPHLSEKKKIESLNLCIDALNGRVQAGFECAGLMAESLAQTGVSDRHCRDLIAAFKLDVVKNRYHDWDDLMGYCALSANSVGRYLLDLHDEQAEAVVCSDALCSALQILNHIQDCRDDFTTLNRIYLPTDWLEAEKAAEDDLKASRCSPNLRRVIDRCLLEVDGLLAIAADLPARLHSRRLAMESAAILTIAKRLAGHLARRDPLPERVRLGKASYLVCCLFGAWRGFFR